MNNDNFERPRVKIARRMVFARQFQDYPVVLRGFARGAGLGYPGEKTIEREQAAARQLASPHFVHRVSGAVAGQFAIRLIATRASMEPSSPEYGLRDFARLEMLPGLMTVLDDLDGFSIQGTPEALKAIDAVHSSMAATVFDALAVEALADDFDEAAFWPDVFRGLADTDDTGALVRSLSPVILDRLDRLRHVFRTMTGGHALDLTH
jgi:hypothetical protein